MGGYISLAHVTRWQTSSGASCPMFMLLEPAPPTAATRASSAALPRRGAGPILLSAAAGGAGPSLLLLGLQGQVCHLLQVFVSSGQLTCNSCNVCGAPPVQRLARDGINSPVLMPPGPALHNVWVRSGASSVQPSHIKKSLSSSPDQRCLALWQYRPGLRFGPR